MSATIQIDPMLLIEAQLRHALEEKKRAGWTINPDIPCSFLDCTCCLLGAMVTCRKEVAGNFYSYQVVAAMRLKVASKEALELEAGFRADDELFTPGYPKANQSSPFYTLGAKLRAQYVNQ